MKKEKEIERKKERKKERKREIERNKERKKMFDLKSVHIISINCLVGLSFFSYLSLHLSSFLSRLFDKYQPSNHFKVGLLRFGTDLKLSLNIKMKIEVIVKCELFFSGMGNIQK